MFALEFRDKVNREETGVMGLLSGESCMILIPNFTRFCLTDRQTDRRTGDSI